MRYKVYSVSGPSWQPIKDGKPYRKYVGTVRLVPNIQGGALVMRTLTVFSPNEDVVKRKLEKYMFMPFVDIDEAKLDEIPRIKGVSHASTNR